MSAWDEIDEAADKRIQDLEDRFRRKYRFSMGHTEITCRRCGHMTTVENEELEAMREFRCPVCERSMTDHEIARIKGHYYMLLWQSFEQAFGKIMEFFDYNISLNPHYEERTETEKELSSNEQ